MSRARPRVIVSACLLGERTRYDGRLRRDAVVADELAAALELRAVCPEVGMGLPVPRDPMRLEGAADAPRMVVIRTAEDLTGVMDRWLGAALDELDAWGPDGLILKARSPSCGLAGVPRFGGVEASVDDGTGLFALAARRRWPAAVAVEAEQLADPAARADFLARVRARARGRRGGRPASR